MDNRRIDATSEGEEALGLALRLIWPNAAGGKATHYKVLNLKRKVTYYPPTKPDGRTSHSECLEAAEDGCPTLILLWGEEQSATSLPFPLRLDEAPAFVWGWLKQADYGNQPDHDGSNARGWRVFTESWGHVAGHHYAIVGVQPAWAMYGK